MGSEEANWGMAVACGRYKFVTVSLTKQFRNGRGRWPKPTVYFILVWESSAGVISVRLLRSHGAPGAPLKQGDWHIIYITCACTLKVY